MIDFWKTLISEGNIAGFWAVVGASITLLGIFLNNIFESVRQRKERQLSIIKDGYFDALNYVALLNQIVSALANDANGDLPSDADSSKFYKLFLVGSPDIISSLMKAVSVYERTILKAAKEKMNVVQYRIEVEGAQKMVTMALDRMNEVNEKKSEYNRSGGNNPEYFGLLSRQFTQAENSFVEYQQAADIAQRKRTKEHLSLLNTCTLGLQEASPLVYDTALKMRNDIDRRLKKKDQKYIAAVVEKALLAQKMNTDEFISFIHKKIKALEEEAIETANQ